MSMVTYPLNNIEYSAEDAELFNVTRTSGVYAANSFEYSISGADNIIEIGTGIAWIKNSDFAGKVVAQKAPISINMGVSDPNFPRIDAVVIQFNTMTNSTQIVSKTGTAQTNPIAPEIIQTESLYELHLYHILRPVGSVSITIDNITDMRMDETYCGIMRDSVTRIPTDQLQNQAQALIEQLRQEILAVESGAAVLLKNTYDPQGRNTDIFAYIDNVKNELKSVTVTLLSSGWGDSAPYMQTVTVANMTAEWIPGNPILVAEENRETNQALQEALSQVNQITSAANALTFICYVDKPEIDMTIIIPGVI